MKIAHKQFLHRNRFTHAYTGKNGKLVPVTETPSYDPSPYCQHCGAKEEKHCKCGPIARNH